MDWTTSYVRRTLEFMVLSLKNKIPSVALTAKGSIILPVVPVLLPLLLSAAVLAGPVSPLYLTAGQQNTLIIVQGTNVIKSWDIPNNSYAISVMGTVQLSVGASGFLDSEYSLDGKAIGTDSTFPNVPGTLICDGASDGYYRYAWDFTQNRVLRFNSNWSNPQPLFAIGGTSDDFIGIAFDPSNNSFWVSGWNKSEIRNYSSTGQLLTAFPVSHDKISALALDPATGTLWAANGNEWGLFEEYSKTGALLSTQYYPELSGMNVLGGEFNVVPEDSTPPTIESLSATPNVLWPPDNRMVCVNLKVNAVDNYDPSPISRITQVTSNQPRNRFFQDWKITGPLSVNLRAEVFESAKPPIYTITIETTDESGNVHQLQLMSLSIPLSEGCRHDKTRPPDRIKSIQ